MTKKGKTQRFLDTHPKSKKAKKAYDKKYNARPDQVKKRTELNKINRKANTYGNGDKKDASHTKRGIVFKPQSVNRASRSDQPGDRRARGSRKSL